MSWARRLGRAVRALRRRLAPADEPIGVPPSVAALYAIVSDHTLADPLRLAMLQFRSSVKTAELALTTARIRLQTLLGRAPGQSFIDISDPMRVPVPTQAPALEQIQARALTVRPDIEAARLDQARSQSELGPWAWHPFGVLLKIPPFHGLPIGRGSHYLLFFCESLDGFGRPT